MPTKKEAWSCKFCGMPSPTKYLAEACEAVHVHADELVITNLELHPKHNKYYYNAGDRMPSAIRIAGKDIDVEGIYVLKSGSVGAQIQLSTHDKE